MESITNPIIKAIYFHHELIRIHPFADGNGRVTRVAKNWMLMYDLYPPIFVNDAPQKTEYITTLSKVLEHLINHQINGTNIHKHFLNWN
ncbi:MAG: Fic family protein [Bacteroidetes bacterium]|nr:Fic family protein [Bacteroidota bacterium]